MRDIWTSLPLSLDKDVGFYPDPRLGKDLQSVEAKLALSGMNEEEFTQKPCHKESLFSGPCKINIWSSGLHEAMEVY